MGLSVGIVGLPNVGKSTLFNALLKKQQAYVANFPFATIEPNVGVVPVPDERLHQLAETIKKAENIDHLPPEVPAIVEFIDIAGLISGAHKGEGLGNKFLAHIREVSAICHVVRAFSDENIVKEGVVNPKRDFETVETELKLADLQTLEKQKDLGGTTDKEVLEKWDIVKKLKKILGEGKPAREFIAERKEDIRYIKELSLLTSKLILIVVNVDEDDLKNTEELEKKYAKDFGVGENRVVAISAKLESQLAQLSVEEQKGYLTDLGVDQSGLERLIKKAFSTLNLMNFLTAGEKEVRAWVIKKGTNAQKAAGVIHSDFEKNFIKVDVVNFSDFVDFGGWKKSRELGKVKTEGRDYIIQEGNVVEFKVGS